MKVLKPTWELKNLSIKDSNYIGVQSFTIEATFLVDAKYWTKLKKAKNLGQLYGVELCNYLHQLNKNIPAYNPTLDHNSRASKGLKTIKLSFDTTDPHKAEALGFKGITYLKNGEFTACWGSYPVVRFNQELKLIQGGNQ